MDNTSMDNTYMWTINIIMDKELSKCKRLYFKDGRFY